MRHSDGLFHIGGKTYPNLTGSRAQVKHHKAYQTAGGLTDKDLKYNKSGKIVSRKKSEANPIVRLLRKGYHTMKGRFGHVKREVKAVPDPAAQETPLYPKTTQTPPQVPAQEIPAPSLSNPKFVCYSIF